MRHPVPDHESGTPADLCRQPSASVRPDYGVRPSGDETEYAGSAVNGWPAAGLGKQPDGASWATPSSAHGRVSMRSQWDPELQGRIEPMAFGL
jgi:hypothetical protein